MFTDTCDAVIYMVYRLYLQTLISEMPKLARGSKHPGNLSRLHGRLYIEMLDSSQTGFMKILDLKPMILTSYLLFTYDLVGGTESCIIVFRVASEYEQH